MHGKYSVAARMRLCGVLDTFMLLYVLCVVNRDAESFG